jgi:hypothetical protein
MTFLDFWTLAEAFFPADLFDVIFAGFLTTLVMDIAGIPFGNLIKSGV